VPYFPYIGLFTATRKYRSALSNSEW
jgi:hypothetical protein